jgi:hypothetical protein
MGNKGESFMKGGFFVRDRYHFSRKTLQMIPTVTFKAKKLSIKSQQLFLLMLELKITSS